MSVLFTSTLLLCAVLLIRGLLKQKMSLRLRYALWALVLARLLLPVELWTSPISVMNAVSLPETAVLLRSEPRRADMSPWENNNQAAPLPPAVNMGGAAVSQGNGDSIQNPAEVGALLQPPAEPGEITAPYTPTGLPVGAQGEVQKTALDLPTLLRVIWLAGALCVGGWFLLSNLRFFLRLRRDSVLKVDIICSIPVYQADFLPSPCLVGLFRPRIYLTARLPEGKNTLQHILTHELCHKRHGDNWWALLRVLCLALWWFHPLVWLAAVLSRRDCELACDEAAVARLGEGERLPYGQTLVAMVARRPVAVDLLMASTAMTAGKHEIRERVITVAKKRRMPKGVLVLSVVLAAMAALCTFTGAVEKPGEPSPETPLPFQVEPDPNLRLDALDLSLVSIPAPDGSNPNVISANSPEDLEINVQWMAAYGRQFYALPDGNPWKADDVLVFRIRSERSQWVTLAVHPVGGLDAVRDLFIGGVPHGTGEYSDYVMMEYHVTPREYTQPDGTKVLVGINQEDGTPYVTPTWHRTKPPEGKDMTTEQLAMWAKDLPLNITALVEGTGAEAWAEAGEQWAEAYIEHHLVTPDNGNPAWADDTKLLFMDLVAKDDDEAPENLWFHLRYAYRPVWGQEGAVGFHWAYSGNHVGVSQGEGDLEGYILVDCTVTLHNSGPRGESWTGWIGTDLKNNYPDDSGRLRLGQQTDVPKKEDGAPLKDLDPSAVTVRYPSGSDETKMENVGSTWAIRLAQQFYQLPADHPLYSNYVQLHLDYPFSPAKLTASGAKKVVNEANEYFWLAFHPVNGVEGAEKYFDGEARGNVGNLDCKDCVLVILSASMVRSREGGDTVWTCSKLWWGDSEAEKAAGKASTYTGDLSPLPLRVPWRAGYAISALDYDAVYVPDLNFNTRNETDKQELTVRYFTAFAQQFYALPETNPWKATDVIIRFTQGSAVQLAIKPKNGAAALEAYFPGGATKGQGALEGYLLLQLTASLEQQVVEGWGDEPVWTATSGTTIWGYAPPEVGSDEWNQMVDPEHSGDETNQYGAWENRWMNGYTRTDMPEGKLETWPQVGLDWADNYLKRQMWFGNSYSERGNPASAADTELLSMDLKAYSTGDGPQQLVFRFRYAFKPLWGMEIAKAFYLNGETRGVVQYGKDESGEYNLIIRDYPVVILTYNPEYGYWSNELIVKPAQVPSGAGWVQVN